MPNRKELPKDLPLSVQAELLFHPEANPTDYVPFENATDYPFKPDADALSRVNAWWLADASWIAYWHNEADVGKVFRDQAGLPSCRLIANEGTACYVAHNDTFAIVTFRGTQPDDWQDLFDIARFHVVPWDIGHVHHGFAKALEVLREPLEDALNGLPSGCRVWFTGHSLGGALATLAAYRYRAAGVYTVGSPSVGNGVFAGQFGPVFEERSMRYVNDHDVVTHVPPGPFALPHGLYTQVDYQRWINKDGTIGTMQPTLPHFVRDVFGRSNVLLGFVELVRRGFPIELPAALSDHTPLYYALHCWNDFATQAPGLS